MLSNHVYDGIHYDVATSLTMKWQHLIMTWPYLSDYEVATSDYDMATLV